MKPNLLCTPKSIYDLTPLPVGFLLDFPFIGLKNHLHTQRQLRTNQGKNYSPDDFLPLPPKEYRSIFDLSSEEINERFQARLGEIKKELFAKGLPLTYQDKRCPTADFFIREYEDGTTFLAVIDKDKHEFIAIRQLSPKG